MSGREMRWKKQQRGVNLVAQKEQNFKWCFVSDRDASIYMDMANGLSVRQCSEIYGLQMANIYTIRKRLKWIYYHNFRESPVRESPYQLASFRGVNRGRPGTFYMVKRRPDNY